MAGARAARAVWAAGPAGRGERHAGLALVERLNVAIIMGLPADMADRAPAEARRLFLAWLLMSAWAALRPARAVARRAALSG